MISLDSLPKLTKGQVGRIEELYLIISFYKEKRDFKVFLMLFFAYTFQ